MSHHTCFHSKEFNDTHYGGGKHRHPWTHICTPALPLNDLTPQGERQKKRKYDSVAPSVTLIPESLSQYEHITEMSGILVFKETYFSCKSAPKYKPIAYLVLKETAIHSNFAGNMAVLASMRERVSVGLPDGAF